MLKRLVVFAHWRIELSLIIRSKPVERTMRNHEPRLILKTCCPFRVAGACRKTHIHRGFPCMNPRLDCSSEFRIEEERGLSSVVIRNVVDDVLDLDHIVLVIIPLDLLSEQLSDSVLAHIVEGGVAELKNCLAPVRHRSQYRLQIVDPAGEMDLKTVGHDATEILHCGTEGVEDAGEIAGWMFVWFEVFLVGMLRCHVREPLVEILFADHVVLLERLELGDIAHRSPIVPEDALRLHIARGPDNRFAPLPATEGIVPWIWYSTPASS